MEASSSSSLPPSSSFPPPTSLSSSTSSNQNNTSSPSSSSTPSPSRPQPITRLSSRALRPQLLGVEPSTRMRSRSVTSSSTPKIGQGQDGDLSPTLMGEAQFVNEEQSMGVYVRDDSGEDDGTRTPPDPYVEIFSAAERLDSKVQEERDRQGVRIDPKVDGSPTIERKRGRSFTSLLMGGIGVGGRSSSPSIEVHTGTTFTSRGKNTFAREATIYEAFSLPSTPRTSTDSISLLPLSTHPIFSPPSKPSKSLLSFLPQLAYLFFLFSASSLVIFGLLYTLPSLSLPHTLSDLPALYTSLSTYAQTSSLASLHLFLVLSSVYLWKQCFSIPGSLLSNVLLGAMYGTGWGTFWACAGTAGGSTGAYLVARGVGPLVGFLYHGSQKESRMLTFPLYVQVEYYFEKPLNFTKKALNLPISHEKSQEGSFSSDKEVELIPTSPSQSDLFSHLLLARFFPLLPYSVLNVSSCTTPHFTPSFSDHICAHSDNIRCTSPPSIHLLLDTLHRLLPLQLRHD